MHVCLSVCLCVYQALFNMSLSLDRNHYIRHIRVDVLHTISRSKGQRSSSHVISIEIVDLAICFRGRSLDTIERHLQQAVNSIHEWATRNGLKFAAHKCKVIHFTAPWSKVQRPPVIRIPASRGVNKVPWAEVGLSPLLQEAHQCVKNSARRLLTSSEWSLTWSGEGTETHSWYCTEQLFGPSWTMVSLCMVQHRTPIYDNSIVSTTPDWDWH